MLQLRRSEDRGMSEHGGWLNSRHSFSFADYYDPKFMGFSVLRVINDDVVAPGAGFPKHGHRDMEIISVVLQGSIAHKDSIGHITELRAGEVQHMSAGTGITHSEYNPSSDEVLRFLQIWIEPDRMGITPSYDQRDISKSMQGVMNLIISPDRRDGSMQLQQDARVYLGRLTAEDSPAGKMTHTLSQPLNQQRKYYLHLISGELNVNQQILSAGDAVAIENESELSLVSKADSEFIFFDLP